MAGSKRLVWGSRLLTDGERDVEKNRKGRVGIIIDCEASFKSISFGSPSFCWDLRYPLCS